MVATGWPLPQVLAAVTSNPARLLGRPEPTLDAGAPANLVHFRRPQPEGFALDRVCVDGVWEQGTESSSRARTRAP
jgi:predicted amidohydrolase